MSNFIKEAYDAGVRAALEELGLMEKAGTNKWQGALDEIASYAARAPARQTQTIAENQLGNIALRMRGTPEVGDALKTYGKTLKRHTSGSGALVRDNELGGYRLEQLRAELRDLVTNPGRSQASQYDHFLGSPTNLAGPVGHLPG